MGCASSSSVLKQTAVLTKQNALLADLVETLRKEADATKKMLTDRIVKIENTLENDVELVVDENEEEVELEDEEEEEVEPVPDRRLHFLNFTW